MLTAGGIANETTMNERLQDLLKRRAENRITREELRELKNLINTFGFRKYFTREFSRTFHKDDATEALSAEEAEKMYEEIVATKTEPKVVPLQRSKIYLRWAAAAILVIGAGAYVYNLTQVASPTMAVQQGSEDNRITLIDTNNAYTLLPDGSTVFLNKGSVLTYDESFGGDVREVILEGEAYFDVKPDPARPFRVRSRSVTTEVLGTAFNVKAYAQQEEITVTVTRGKVRVKDGVHHDVILPNEQISVKPSEQRFEKSTVDATATVRWTNRFLILDHVTWEEAAKILGQRYNVNVELSHKGLRHCGITATFLQERSLEEVLAVISELHGTTYRILDGGRVIIDGEGCNHP